MTPTGSARQANNANRANGGPLRLTGLAAVLVLVAGGAVGALIDGLSRRGPDLILGLCLAAGAALATMFVRRGIAWVIIPLPPLVYVVMAVAAGVVADHNSYRTTRRLLTATGTWMAKGFPEMILATVVAAGVFLLRVIADHRRAATFDPVMGEPRRGSERH